PGPFVAFNGELYFNAADVAHGAELWKVRVDGFVVRVMDINPGATNSNATEFTPFNGELYFQANNGTHGDELWKVRSDGSAVLVMDINPGAGDSLHVAGLNGFTPAGFTAFHGELYFRANDGTHGMELWKVKT